MHVDPASDRAVYRQIADHLRAEIEKGLHEPGKPLPSESRIVAKYDVSRVTARRALQVLVTDGLVIAEHGRGWIVRRKPPVKRLGSDRFARRAQGKAAFTVDMEASNRPFRVEVLHVGRSEVPADMAARLGVDAGDQVVVRRRRYFAEDQPIEIATSYIPLDVAEGTPIEQENPGPGGIYARMEDKGMIFERYDEEISARMPTEEETRLLQLPPASPIFRLIRTATASGRPVEVCDTVYDASAVVLNYSLPAKLPE
jgi:GntR family transcriptional regulator